MTSNDQRLPLLRIRDLNVTLPSGRRLLRRTNLDIREQELVVLVGPSGSGKTTLLRLIAGIHEPDDGLLIEGEVLVGSEKNRHNKTPIGLVFQDRALFDEFSAAANVQFAIDHSTSRADHSLETANGLLKQMQVPLDTPLARMSGGERQRVAIARALAMNPPILLFDEPTTGLDPARSRDIVERITQTQRNTGKTVVVVTHDYAPFLQYSPRLVLLDEQEHSLVEVREEELRIYFDKVLSLQEEIESNSTPTPAERQFPGISMLEKPGLALLTLFNSPVAALQGWQQAKWKLRYLWHYSKMVAFGSTAVYVAIAGAMLGFVFTSFGFQRLPYAEVTIPLVTEELLAATGYSTYRVIIPLLIAVLLAGKCGAAIAADVGTRRHSHQFDAMRSLGVKPETYLLGNASIALFIASPILTIIAFVSNYWAAMTAYLMTSQDTTLTAFRRNFLATVWPTDRALPIGTGWVVLKATTSALLIAALAYTIGARRKQSAVDVSKDVGLTIFWATLAVLTLHSVYSLIEF